MTPSPDPSAYYRLTNHYTGPSAPLSVYRDRATGYIYLTTRNATNTPTWSTSNNEPTITPYWQILQIHGSDPPRYSICAEFHDSDFNDDNDNDDSYDEKKGGKKPISQKASVFLALDIFNKDKTKPHLKKAGFYSGQYWSITPWPRRGSEDDHGAAEYDDGDRNATIRDVMLRNDWSGEDLHLDTYSDTKQGFLDGGDHMGQHWVLEKVEKKGGRAVARKEVSDKACPVQTPQRTVDRGMTVMLFAFGTGFGAAVVVAMAWVELLPLLLIVGLTLGGGVWLGMMSPRQSLKHDGKRMMITMG